MQWRHQVCWYTENAWSATPSQVNVDSTATLPLLPIHLAHSKFVKRVPSPQAMDSGWGYIFRPFTSCHTNSSGPPFLETTTGFPALHASRRFLNRHSRWGKLRWKIGGMKYLSELLGNFVFISSLPILFLEPSRLSLTFAGLVSSIKILGDFYIGKRTKTKMNFLLYFLSPVKDLLIGLIWFVPLFSSTVVWRGNRYRIGKDSRLSSCPDSGFWSWRYRFVDNIKARLAWFHLILI